MFQHGGFAPGDSPQAVNPACEFILKTDPFVSVFHVKSFFRLAIIFDAVRRPLPYEVGEE
jgi:hypothetical protein